jgi:hypothetical protein
LVQIETHLLHEFDFAGTPGFFDPGLERAIDPQDGEPALSRQGFKPIVLIAFGGFRSEVDIIGTIVVLLNALGLATDGRELLAGLQHGARLAVIVRDCPKIFGGNICRNMQLVGLGPVERLLFRIHEGD